MFLSSLKKGKKKPLRRPFFDLHKDILRKLHKFYLEYFVALDIVCELPTRMFSFFFTYTFIRIPWDFVNV